MKKILLSGLITIILTIGLVLAWCGGTNCSNDGNCIEVTQYQLREHGMYSTGCSDSNCAAVRRNQQPGFPSVAVKCDCK